MPVFTNAVSTLFFLSRSFGCFSPCVFPSIVYVSNSRSSGNSKFCHLNLTAAIEWRFLLLSSKAMSCGFSGIVRRCKCLDSEGDFALEAELLQFMENSKNPEAFPSKKDLVDAGREDLVVAIVKKGGWLSLGWNLDEEEDEGVRKTCLDDLDTEVANDFGSLDEFRCSDSDDRQRSAVATSSLAYSSPSSSLTGRSLEIGSEDESGIEAMLSRLEKERKATFGVGFPGSVGRNEWHPETTANETVVGLGGSTMVKSLSAKEGMWKDLEDDLSQTSSVRINGLGDSVSPGMRRTCSTYKGEHEVVDLKATEIALSNVRNGEALDVSRDETVGSSTESNKVNWRQEGLDHNLIRQHLQHLQSEFSSILCSLRSSTLVSHKGQRSSSDNLLKLSDTWEFQEDEILNAKNKLRSARAKLAVAEGRLALTIVDTQKKIEEKQKRINSARRALQNLRTACVVWPNSAAEVLLAGSFDGWATQWKMEKSSTGVFSVFLKLYPGKYEIKFIVDGQWKIDPLRPIVNSSGYENNLLIIT